jgi:hypothetical protein
MSFSDFSIRDELALPPPAPGLPSWRVGEMKLDERFDKIIDNNPDATHSMAVALIRQKDLDRKTKLRKKAEDKHKKVGRR